MSYTNRFISTLLAFALFFLCNASGFAQATRTWVSGVGDDANPCSRTAPCKTFAGAISRTASFGIISVLDPAGYGAVTITKSITIENVGDVASILASGVNGVVVNAAATDTVVLRGLFIDGTSPGGPSGTNGIRFINGARLVVERCTIQNFTQNGIDFEPAGAAHLVVKDTTVSKAGNGAIFVQAGSSGSATATLERSLLTDSRYGLLVQRGVVSAKDLVISGSDNAGVNAVGSGGNVIRVSLDNSLINDGAGYAISTFGSQTSVYLAHTTITNNATALQVLMGSVFSYGNNRIFGNTVSGASPSMISEQ